MTSSLDQITENPDRSQAILKLIWAAGSGENACTFEAVAAKAGELFGAAEPLSQEEYDCGVQMVALAAAAEPEAPAMTRDQANARLKELQETLFAARKQRMLAEAEQAKCRASMAAAILEWSQGGESVDAIKRREIAAINRDRANKINNGDQRRPGKSRIDQQAFYGAGGDANDYARKLNRFGSHHRATAATPGGTLQVPGRRGTTRAVPSER